MIEPETQARRICDAWRSLRIEDVVTMRVSDVGRAVSWLLGGDPGRALSGRFRFGGLLQTEGLERFVLRTIPWRGIRRGLTAGCFRALAVSATQMATGHTVVFIDSADSVPTSGSSDPHVRHRQARIGPRHVLASAAIPLFFPSVKIGNYFFADGGLRQNTPMSPAIRLGADRLLVVSLRHRQRRRVQEDVLPQPIDYPKPLFVLGKMLDALLLDHTDHDLDRMVRLNGLLAAGGKAFGAGFRDVLNHELVLLRGAPVRSLEAVHIRPSQDIGAMASDFVARGRVRIRGRIARMVIERLARGESARENDLLSYLMFDGDYAADLIDLGYHDAEAREEELARLFSVPRRDS